ncbi:histone H4 transcription factor [Toxorhynchites rutilus septentrionalis]|uniref:histone H4 transcription factor n=1 Tax=Toxorhynchites rutilus septentrionalis TaxID=329112 RepID=UPI002478B50D|nr:histone H4 transcription factor [Toxorhynchites rutilus septentrionalis]
MGRKRKSGSPNKAPCSPKQGKFELVIKEEPELIIDDYNTIEGAAIVPSGANECSDNIPTTAQKNGDLWVDKCEKWITQQQEMINSETPPECPEAEDDELLMDDQQHLMDEPTQSNVGIEVPIRCQLKNFSDKQIYHSVMYECEWLKCGFETIEDIVYIKHVEEHAYLLANTSRDDEEFICRWDLCHFRTNNAEEFVGHVHFHAYHGRLKTYGASLSSIITIPKCNSDSKRRNSLNNFKTSFRCEWDNCNEMYYKAEQFFMHVNIHVQDQFPLYKKSTKETLECKWPDCKQTYKRRSIALEHVRTHSTERSIGCYTCGALFSSRLKYADHCRRQVEYHNREYSCPDCDKLFATKQLMADHRHIHNKKFACALCPMMWPSPKALSYHIRYRHVEDKPFQCHLCKHRTVTKADLSEHVLTHDERRMFQCEEFGCDAAYKCQKSLKKHVDSVHYGTGPGTYECHQCTNLYKSSAGLTKHLVRFHRYKRPVGYTRFTYRPGQDGIFRMVPFWDGYDMQYDHTTQLKTEKKPRKIKIKTNVEKAKEAKETKESGTYTSFTIEEFKPVAQNTFSIELKPGKEMPKPLLVKKVASKPKADLKKENHDEPVASCSTVKNIDDFTVMKRYIKVEKPVEISFEETDSTGSVIRSKTVQTTELTADNLLKTVLKT